jgi:hypothetical protein
MSYDVSPALSYGDIVFVFTADEPLPVQDPTAAITRAHAVLCDITEDDYLVWAGGDPLGLVIAGAVAADYLDGKVRYLKWERARDGDVRSPTRGFYAPVKLDIFPQGESI